MTSVNPVDTLTAEILARVRDVPDFPTPGVLFKDITPLLADGGAFARVVEAIAEPHRQDVRPVDVVVGIEARGFILAAPVAVALGVGFVPVRKVGKLPSVTVSASYELEYGTAEVEVHADGVRPGQHVLLVDDVLATGGTAAAATALVQRLGGVMIGVSVLMELAVLGGRNRLPGLDVRSLVAV
ncbi:MAG TPA: adenine phosphoribosyltransferase [Kineosporiaceae bacterium]|nr:adenine phosphoribosyltransferase [Kineosporiaceae bacterium]